MKTKWLMSVSAIFMGLLGLTGTFLPEEMLTWFELEPSSLVLILLQMLGGLYLGFALLNWFTRFARIGGIYNRPIVLGNLLHYTVVALTLVRQYTIHADPLFTLITIIYVLLAVWFAFVLVSNPLKNEVK